MKLRLLARGVLSLLMGGLLGTVLAGMAPAAQGGSKADTLERDVAALDKKLMQGLRAADVETLKEGDVPTSGEFAANMQPLLEKYKGVLKRIENQQKSVNREIKNGEATREQRATLDQLEALQSRVSKLVRRSDRFAVGSTWTGTLTGPYRVFKVKLTIKDSKPGRFSGELGELGKEGRASLFDVSGAVKGQDFSMETLRAKFGDNNKQHFKGTIKGNSIHAAAEVLMLNNRKKLEKRVGTLELEWDG